MGRAAAGGLRALLFAAGMAAVLLALALPATARDLVGWGRARWGMTAAALDAAYGGGLGMFEPPLAFAGTEAPRFRAGVTVGGVRFTALFHFAPHGGGLVQVVLMRPRNLATPADYVAAARALGADLGPPDRRCTGHGGGATRGFMWVFPTTTVQLDFLDFGGSIITEDPFTNSDSLANSARRRGYNDNLPRRLVIRYFPTDRADLRGPCAGAG